MKTFFTHEQQIEKLKNDGLIINDEDTAIKELQLKGYYNIINGYSPIFKQNARFIKGTTFENINALYDFDKDLRSIVYKYTSLIECHIKALIAHEFSRVHGVDEKTYLTTSSFTMNAKATENVKRLIEICNNTITKALDKSSNKYREYIAHNYNAHGHVPMWVLIRALSFGTTSIFYKNMLDEEKDTIAKNYSLTSAQLANMLEVVVSYRNIVAHGERTFCARLPKVRLTTNLSIVKKLCIAKNKKGSNKYGRNDLLALLICFKYLLPSLNFSSFMYELENAMNILKNKQTQLIFSKIKIEMGLKSNAWKILPKLGI